MKKEFILIIIIIFIANLTGCDVQNDNNSTKQLVKIAALLPLTGVESSQGEWAKNGLELALEKVNQESDIYEFEIVYGDTQTNPAETLNAYNNLNNLNEFDFMLTLGSPFALSLAPKANENQQALFAIAASPDYSSPDDFTFRIVPPTLQEGAVLAKTLIDNLDYHELAILYQNNDYGLGVKHSFETSYQELGGKIISQEYFSPDDFDFKTQISKLKDKNPQAVFLAAWGKQAGKIIKQSFELGFKSQFICGQACTNPDFFSGSGEAGQGTLISSLPVNSNSEFYISYQNTYQHQPSYVPERMYYTLLTISQLKDWCGDDKQCYLDKLYSQEFEISSGQVTFDQYGDINDEFKIFRVEDGEFLAIE